MTKELQSRLQNLPLVLAGNVDFRQLLAFQRGLPMFEAVKNMLGLILLCSEDLCGVHLFAFLPKHEYLLSTLPRSVFSPPAMVQQTFASSANETVKMF